jgi:hypothetical protein
MPPPRTLVIELLSDTTFARGEGTAGIVDVEVDHDEVGLPLVRGKRLHGLLRDGWLSLRDHFPLLTEAARRVLGEEADLQELAVLRLGDARLPSAVRGWAEFAIGRERHPLRPDQVLATLTDIRRQTAISRLTGAPERKTLRSSRVVLRKLSFAAPLEWLAHPEAADVRCLALCALAVRHGGWGFLCLTLDGDLHGTRRLAEVEGVVA